MKFRKNTWGFMLFVILYGISPAVSTADTVCYDGYGNALSGEKCKQIIRKKWQEAFNPELTDTTDTAGETITPYTPIPSPSSYSGAGTSDYSPIPSPSGKSETKSGGDIYSARTPFLEKSYLSSDKKKEALNTAIEITKEAVRGGNSTSDPDILLEQLYQTTLKLLENVENQSPQR